MKLIQKAISIAALSLVAGAVGAVGNALGARYLVPLVESRLPSRVSPEADAERQQDMPVRHPGSPVGTAYPPA